MSALEKYEVAYSHATKMRVFYECVQEMEPNSLAAKFYISEAAELLKDEKYALLRAHSKELDVIFRETIEPNLQPVFVQRMLDQGVRREHLPALATVRKLRAMIRRGTIRSNDELQLVRAALDGNAHGQLNESELKALGLLFDLSSAKNTARAG